MNYQALYDHFLIVDIESTCCDKNSIPRDQHEMIEIGAVMVDAKSLREVDSFQTFIRPQKHPRLTPFCKVLTSISQHDVDTAPDFINASLALKKWLINYPNHLFCSWGNYDKNHLNSESKTNNIETPILAPHINLKREFAVQLRVKRIGMQLALEHVGIELTGTHHRGIDDARNISKLLPYCLGLK